MDPGVICFWLNHQRIEVRGLPPTTTLLRYLRDHAGLAGTKEGCAEGDCGACTVAVLEERADRPATWRAINACLLLLPMLQGKRVVTVEALREGRGAGADGLHPAQLAMIESRGSQCGYCTPGIVMSLFEATYRPDLTEPWQLDDQLCGNLCRCTGYRPIRDAARAVAATCPADRFQAEARVYRRGPAGLDYTAPTRAGDQRYLSPTSMSQLLTLKAAHPEAVLVAGATDLGLSVTKKHAHLPLCIGLGAVPELADLTAHQGYWEVGAATTLTSLDEAVGAQLPGLAKLLRVFGSRQIRSSATLGGNLCTASPIGDLGPALVALGAEAVLASTSGERTLPLEAFFTGYRTTALRADEILRAVRIPRVARGTFYTTYKVSKRRELDISTVAAGMLVELGEGGLVKRIRLAFGGLSAVPARRAEHTEAALWDGPWTEEAVLAAAPHLDEDFAPIDDLRGSAAYRRLLARNLLLGFWLDSQHPHANGVVGEPVGTVLSTGDALEVS